jgi:hypothetical protein
MNDPQIREAFHRIVLRNCHNSLATLVVNELGLEHGRCRADIAVINGHLIGYEIKSDVDSLKRLAFQIETYNTVFDLSSVVLTERHLSEVMRMIPDWWGVILATENNKKFIHFEHLRSPIQNTFTKDYSVVQLLWRDEAQQVLMKLGIQGAQLRKSRSCLYKDIINLLEPPVLRNIVREFLKKRQGWRDHVLPFPNDG